MRTGLISLFLMTCLAACGTKPVALPVAPPAALLADCPETPTEVDRAVQALIEQAPYREVTNGDLVRKIRQLRVDLQLCNADKAALREWTSEMTP